MNNIKDCENLSSKRVLLRLDLNVPLKNGDIVDETRIIKIIPIIEFLIKRNAKILIISHVGRPKGKFNKDLSLKPICDYLEKKIKIEQIRKLLVFLSKSTYYKGVKIVLLDNAEYLNINSSNALLKAIEEPSKDTYFFIIISIF